MTRAKSKRSSAKKTKKPTPPKASGSLASNKKLKDRIAQLERQAMVAERLRFESLRNTRASNGAPSFDASTFVAGVAHEFNNILGAADGHAEWALSSGRSEDMKEALETIRVACRRSAQITRGLQGLFQPREEKKLVFALRSSFDEVSHMLRARCEKEGVALDIQVPDVQVYGEPGRVLEVLVNLIKNSLDAFLGAEASKAKGPRIEVRGRLQKKGKSSSVLIQVQDNGPGIPEVLRDLIFQPFFTTKGTLAGALGQESSGVGSGLGLYLSRQILEEHGGTLKCLPSPKGALFELSLPLAV